tara:strand:+ start:999 stop:1232 length:234 start_codon:yes stop_codon:yes gene_type:complete
VNRAAKPFDSGAKWLELRRRVFFRVVEERRFLHRVAATPLRFEGEVEGVVVVEATSSSPRSLASPELIADFWTVGMI